VNRKLKILLSTVLLGSSLFAQQTHKFKSYRLVGDKKNDNATVYFVNQKSASANDAGPGTKQIPFKTISAAIDHVKAGDKILIYAGIYREGVELKSSGEEGKPITIEAADPGRVIVRGSTVIKDWKSAAEKAAVFIHDGWMKYFEPQSPNKTDARSKPRNQLYCDGVYIEEVFKHEELKENSFFIDREKKQIYLWLLKGEDPNKKVIEITDRESLFNIFSKNYIVLRGIQFEHGASAGQHALVKIIGNNCIVEDCKVSWGAATGLGLSGKNHLVRRCVFNYNGQQGFNVSGSADCRIEDCESSYNNNHKNKIYDINWEAGGNKIVRAFRLVIERHQAHFNRGDGIWFDISNNECEVKNSLCTNNSRAGLFWEISYVAYIHDNVFMSNGQGILMGESNGPVAERNILIGNNNGLVFRDMYRITSPPVAAAQTGGNEEPIWNHNQVYKNNVLAFNKNSQIRGSFANNLERMVPKALQNKQPNNKHEDSVVLAAKDYESRRRAVGQPVGLSLEKLNIKVDNNIYWGDSIPTLYQWTEKRYKKLEDVNNDLKFEANGKTIDPQFADWEKLDLRVPKGSALIGRRCYPEGRIPGVKLGSL
jgi:hypothetical protein